jgi:hypothetical protein
MATPGRGSQQKGKNHEREVAKIISEALGVSAKRTASPERWKINKGDINAPLWEESIMHDFVWEAKCRESWSILDWYHKLEDDIGLTTKLPVVVASKNHEDQYVFLKLDHFLRVLKELDGYRKADKKAQVS